MIPLSLALALLSTLVNATPDGSPGDIIVVCPQSFRPALAPWVAHRTRQGHAVEFIDNGGSAVEIRQAIRDRAKRGGVRFLLLVGDAEPGLDRSVALRARCVPTHLVTAKVNIRWGSEPEIAGDNWYADLDDDQLPDLAVGRLTADTPTELTAIVGKILRYETAVDFGRWRQKIHFIAGLGGFGALADATIEACAKRFITDGVPAAYSTTMTQASWRSPYCPDPREFGQTTLERLNEGCLFWVYIGHGHATGLDRVSVPGGQYSILEMADVRRMQCQQGSPIALFLCCHAGAFDGPRDCLAEEMLRTDTAPVAIVSGSRVTMPYAMSVLSTEAMKECFLSRRETLGEVWLHAKRNSMLNSRTDGEAQMLDSLAAALNSGTDLAEERMEHVHMFNLLGDPALRLPHAAAATVSAPATVRPGETLRIEGTSEVDGRCTVELVVRRDRLAFRPQLRREYDRTPAVLTAYRAMYERANDSRLASIETMASAGAYSGELIVPADATGDCHVRVFVEGAKGCAMGAANVRVVSGQ